MSVSANVVLWMQIKSKKINGLKREKDRQNNTT